VKAAVKLRPFEGPDGFELTGFVAEPPAYLGDVGDFLEAQIVEAKTRRSGGFPARCRGARDSSRGKAGGVSPWTDLAVTGKPVP
jgi:hypothetical protein